MKKLLILLLISACCSLNAQQRRPYPDNSAIEPGIYTGIFTQGTVKHFVQVEIPKINRFKMYNGLIRVYDADGKKMFGAYRYIGQIPSLRHHQIEALIQQWFTVKGETFSSRKFKAGEWTAEKRSDQQSLRKVLFEFNEKPEQILWRTSWPDLEVVTLQRDAGLSSKYLQDVQIVRDTRVFQAADPVENRVAALLNWSEQMYSEYPEFNFYSNPFSNSYQKIYRLFDDDYFIPVFGKSLSQLAASEHKAIGHAALEAIEHPAYRHAFSWEKEAVDQVFMQEDRFPGRNAIMRKLNDLSPRKDLYRQAIQRITRKDPTLTSADLESYEEFLNTNRDYLLPSEHLLLQNEGYKARIGVAESDIKRAVSTLMHPDIKIDLELANRIRDYLNSRQFLTVGYEFRNQYESQLKQHLEKIMPAIVDTEKSRLATLRDNDLEPLLNWQQRFERDWASFKTFAAVEYLFQEFTLKKWRAIEINFEKLKKEVAAIQTIGALDNKAALLLQPPPPLQYQYLQLQQLIGNRRMVLERIEAEEKAQLNGTGGNPQSTFIFIDEKERQSCYRCGGSGRYSVSDYVTCGSCGGAGRTGSGKYARSCYSCSGGRRQVMKQVTCGACSGRGYTKKQ